MKIVRLLVFSLFIASHCYAEKLTVAFGNTLAPWVMPDTHTGILVDMVREALEPLGYEVENVYYPYARRIHSFRTGQIDIVCDINFINIESSQLMGYYSGVLYHYENSFFSLTENQYKFGSIAELKGYSLLSWQGARYVLGNEYQAMATDNPYYRELHDQEQQVKMLFSGRVDVIQLDKNIFEYYRLKIAQDTSLNAEQAVDKFPLLSAYPNGFLFQDINIRNAFVQQIEIMKKSGKFQALFQQYLKD